MNELITVLAIAAEWAQTVDGTNILFALICVAALTGTPARACVAITLMLHLLLILL